MGFSTVINVRSETEEAAQVSALAGAQMFDCARFPGAVRISERQCLFNQERAAASGFPSCCRDCEEGREIKSRHPEGIELEVHRQANAADRTFRVKRAPAGKPAPPQFSPSRKRGKKVTGASADGSADLCRAPEAPREMVYDPPLPPLPVKIWPPRCDKHGVEKTPDGRGRYICRECKSVNSRAMWDRHRKETGGGRFRGGETMPGRPPMGGEIPLCRKCRAAPQKQPGCYQGLCEGCWQEKPKRAVRKQKKDGATMKKPGSECPKHPQEKQLLDDQGQPSGVCRLCLQERPRRNAKAKKEEIQALRQAASSGEAPGAAAALLAKLPDFDPAWPDELKGKWLDIFQKIIPLAPEEEHRQAGRQAGRDSYVDGRGEMTISPGVCQPEADLSTTKANVNRRRLPEHLRGATDAVKRAYLQD